MITIRVGELAKALGVHRNTIRNWITSGVLEARPTVAKKYAIQNEAFLRFIDEQGISKHAVRKWIQSDPELQVSQQNQRSTQTSNQKEGPMEKHSIGAVMVVGGGIAGIQATLDLADSGYYVYLVEKSPGIGGVMAKLDKTFPTNDCAM
jgi:excisionase family DNA binding protein